MKKTYRLFGMMFLAGAMVFATSCNKENNNAEKATITLPDFEEVLGEPSEAERAYIDFNDGKSFKWNANDEVMIYNLDATDGTNTEIAKYQTDASAQGKKTATFAYEEGTAFGAKKDHYFVFYPVSKIVNNNYTLDGDNYQEFVVDSVQNFTKVGSQITVDPKGLASACEVNTLNDQFLLKHIFGVFRLKLKGTKKVSRIEVVDNSFSLTGSTFMKLHEVNMNRFSSLMNQYTLSGTDLNPAFVSAWNTYKAELNYTTQPLGKKMILDCTTYDADGVQLNNSTQTLFYIGMRPGALIKGFVINVYFSDGTSTTITKYNQPKDSYSIKAGVVTGFSADV